MRMLKKGFTLVEVLVALAILGVISAILIPNISNDIQKRQSAAILAKAIAQIEAGNQDLIQYANTQRVDGSYSDTLATITKEDFGDVTNNKTDSILSAVFNSKVKSFWGLDGQEVTPDPEILTLSGNSFSETTLDTCYVFSKISAGVCINHPTKYPLSDAMDADTGFVMYIDTNGWTEKPNRTGKDIFSFKLLNNGKLVPNTGTADNPIESGDKAQEVVEAGFRIDYY